MINKADMASLNDIENLFYEIRQNNNVTDNLNKMSTILSTVFGKKFIVNIIKTKNNKPSYIMSIFPDESTLDRLVESIINEEKESTIKIIWDENTTWTIEIDELLFKDKNIQPTDRELTALLMHEVGHTIYSNSIPQQLTKVLKLEYARIDIGVKGVFRNNVFKEFLKLPIIQACMSNNYKKRIDLKKEIYADFFAIKMGYGKDLETILDKLIKYGDTKVLSKDPYDELKESTKFSVELGYALAKRKQNVSKENFKRKLVSMPSNFVQNTLGVIYNKIFASKFGKPETVIESCLMNSAEHYYNEAYYTEAFDIFKKKLKKIDTFIPDYINVRMADIQSNDDKLMLVAYIHSRIDLIDYYLDIMDNPDLAKRYIFQNTKSELVYMRKSLERARKDIIKFRIPEVKYGIQIEYPDKYRG